MTTVSTKPYLIRAIYEWCMDQGFTPHVAAVVDERTIVPPGYARDGQIVLNIGPDATHQLTIGNDLINFQARFGGVAHSISVPVGNVVAVYARENGHGMAFEIEPAEEGGPKELEPEDAADGVSPRGPEAEESPPPDDGGRPPGGRGHLKVVK